MNLHPALITLLNMLLLMTATWFVGAARGKYGVKAPKTTGPDGFENAFRAHMNTIESTMLFLPTLWLAALYSPVAPIYVTVIGYVWIVGRFWYLFGYLQSPQKRSMGFLIGTASFVALLVLASWGVIKAMMA